MKRTNKRNVNNFTLSGVQQSQTVYDGGAQTNLSDSSYVKLGSDPLVFRNIYFKPTTSIAPPPETLIKEPTLIIPATEPTEIKTPTGALTTGLQPSTLIAQQPKDYVPMIDPIVKDTTYTLKPLFPGATSLTDVRDQLKQQFPGAFTPKTATQTKSSMWIWVLVAIAVIVLFYLYKKGKL